MNTLCCNARKLNAFLLTAMIWLLAFQNPLGRIWAPFSYIDEAVSVSGVTYTFLVSIKNKKLDLPKYMIVVLVCLSVFVASGLTGNILYHHQPLKSVIIDLYTNLKFFFAIITGYVLFKAVSWADLKTCANWNARIITAALFAIFLLDRIFDFYPAEIRHGIKSAMLFYTHPTYLAGAVAFLLCLKVCFFEKNNYPFLFLDIVLICFTLRSKALVSAMVMLALFMFLVILKRRLKMWHILLLGVLAIAAGWPQIEFYFIELAGWSARSVLLITSIKIMRDHFPIGTGFGTFASSEAEKHYSPVYKKYKFHENWELRDVNDVENTKRLIKKFKMDPTNLWDGPFLNDSFWPIIFGQTGVLGTISYITSLLILIKKSWELQNKNIYVFIAVIYVWIHLLICSMAEPAFNNATAVPLAIIIGISFCAVETGKFQNYTEKDELLWPRKN